MRIRSLDDDLERKTMGIMEPKEFLADGVAAQNLENLWDVPESNPRPLDVLLIPGLAFDPAGTERLDAAASTTTRLSIDTFRDASPRAREPPPLVALAFGAQVLPAGRRPMARWDRRVDGARDGGQSAARVVRGRGRGVGGRGGAARRARADGAAASPRSLSRRFIN